MSDPIKTAAFAVTSFTTSPFVSVSLTSALTIFPPGDPAWWWVLVASLVGSVGFYFLVYHVLKLVNSLLKERKELMEQAQRQVQAELEAGRKVLSKPNPKPEPKTKTQTVIEPKPELRLCPLSPKELVDQFGKIDNMSHNVQEAFLNDYRSTVVTEEGSVSFIKVERDADGELVDIGILGTKDTPSIIFEFRKKDDVKVLKTISKGNHLKASGLISDITPSLIFVKKAVLIGSPKRNNTPK